MANRSRKRPHRRSTASLKTNVERPAPASERKGNFWSGLLNDPRSYCWIAVIVSLACLYRGLASFGEIPNWISSDSLWPVNLIIDVFVDRYDLGGWRFSIAPCWFPDVVLVGITYGLTRNAVLATILAGFLQYVLLLAGVVFCWRALHLQSRRATGVFTLITGAAIALYVGSRPEGGYGAWQQFFLPQSHAGNLVNLVWALALSLVLLDSKNGRRYTVLWTWAMICLLAAMSNVLFVVHYIVPFTAALMTVGFIRGLVAIRTDLLIVSWVSAAAGFLANRILFSGTDISAQAGLGWPAFTAALDTFCRGAAIQFARGDLLHLLAAAWILVCVITTTVLIRRRNEWVPEDLMLLVFFIGCAGSSIGSAVAIIGGGSGTLTTLNNYGVSARYLHPMFFLPLFTWPIVLELFRDRSSKERSGPILLACSGTILLVAGLALARTAKAEVPLQDYAPRLVRDLDRYSQAYGIRYGVAGYWHARVVTLLSKTGLRAYQVDRSLEPFHWVSNVEWYSQQLHNRNLAPVPSFAILNDPLVGMKENDVAAVLGEGLKVTAGGVPVLIYPQRTEAVRAGKCGVTYAETNNLHPASVNFSGSCLSSSTGTQDMQTWVASASHDVAGATFLEPAPRLDSGQYRIEIEYSASGSDDQNIATVQAVYPGESVLYSGTLPVDANRTAGQFFVPERMRSRSLSVRLFFAGFGELRVHHFAIRKVGTPQ